MSAFVDESCSQVRALGGGELGDDPLRERLAELDSPLVEGVDAPHGSLREHAVLVEGDEGAERERA
jgi:hypothetical protein